MKPVGNGKYSTVLELLSNRLLNQSIRPEKYKKLMEHDYFSYHTFLYICSANSCIAEKILSVFKGRFCTNLMNFKDLKTSMVNTANILVKYECIWELTVIRCTVLFTTHVQKKCKSSISLRKTQTLDPHLLLPRQSSRFCYSAVLPWQDILVVSDLHWNWSRPRRQQNQSPGVSLLWPVLTAPV